MKFLPFLFSTLIVVMFFPLTNSDAAIITQTIEGNVVKINHPDTAVIGEPFSVFVFIENTGLKNISYVELIFTIPEASVDYISPNASVIRNVPSGSLAERTFKFTALNDAIPETVFLKLSYTQIMRDEEFQRINEIISIPILFVTKEQSEVKIAAETDSDAIPEPAQITISAVVPEAIFSNEKFPLLVSVTSENVNLNDVTLILVPPKDMNFQGNLTHVFSSMQQNVTATKLFSLFTTAKDNKNEQAIPFQIIVKHTNDFGVEVVVAKTIPLILKPTEAEPEPAPVAEPKQEITSVDETINNEGGGCLIATATFGSELSPQVQQLREIRDNTLLHTKSGSMFMAGFNQLYYSFSPSIADYERENPVFKQAVKITITPLLTSLSILDNVNIDSEAKVLGFGISLILLNIGMYFVAPAFVIIKLKNLIH